MDIDHINMPGAACNSGQLSILAVAEKSTSGKRKKTPAFGSSSKESDFHGHRGSIIQAGHDKDKSFKSSSPMQEYPFQHSLQIKTEQILDVNNPHSINLIYT